VERCSTDLAAGGWSAAQLTLLQVGGALLN